MLVSACSFSLTRIRWGCAGLSGIQSRLRCQHEEHVLLARATGVEPIFHLGNDV
jgi:hypothetical protein